ncbi:hypothetical protein ACEPAI_763 [Sanghuangporus weigelae]
MAEADRNAVRDELPRVSVETLQDWLRVRENFTSASIAALESRLAERGSEDQRHVFLPHIKQASSFPYISLLRLMRCVGLLSDDPNETNPIDWQDMDQFDEALDRRVWSLSDQRLKWDLEIALKRRGVPMEVEALMRDLIAQQRQHDEDLLIGKEGDMDVDEEALEGQQNLSTLNPELVEFGAEVQQLLPEQLERTHRGQIPDWCEQYAQEGYNVFQLSYPIQEDTLKQITAKLSQAKQDFAIISYGFPGEGAEIFRSSVQLLIDLGLKACIHYAPLLDDGKSLLVVDLEGKFVPTTFHIPSAQEKLHASLLPLTDVSNLPYKLKPSQFPPIYVYTYPLVPITPAFPLLTTAPASVVPGKTRVVDPHVLSATNLSYSKTLELLRREIGPRFDLEKIWGEHIYYEFSIRDALKTMSTMVKVPYVNHIPTLTGGVGYDELARFYKYHFTADTVTPPDSEMITVSRTIGADRIIDEMIFKCTHTTMIDYFLPGIEPTGKPLELAVVGVIAFRGDKLCFEYWDQASALVQLGLLDPDKLPVAGKEVAQKVLDPYGRPSNNLMARWRESEGKSIE